jgi:hypothetical protein
MTIQVVDAGLVDSAVEAARGADRGGEMTGASALHPKGREGGCLWSSRGRRVVLVIEVRTALGD